MPVPRAVAFLGDAHAVGQVGQGWVARPCSLAAGRSHILFKLTVIYQLVPGRLDRIWGRCRRAGTVWAWPTHRANPGDQGVPQVNGRCGRFCVGVYHQIGDWRNQRK